MVAAAQLVFIHALLIPNCKRGKPSLNLADASGFRQLVNDPA